MAARRAARRRSFWRNINSEISLETPASTGNIELDGPSEDLYDRDAVPTLIKIIGTLWVTSTRDNVASTDPDTEAAIWGFGLICLEGDEFVDPINQLEHEKWMWTTHGRVEHEAVAMPYGVLLAVGIHYSIQHTPPYPQIREINSKSKRRFEDPCRLVAQARYENVSGLESVAGVKFRFCGRTLWLAS